jgi:hypothetical protein
MDNNILIYEVKSGDTLEKIGGEIGMTGDQLKEFHNTHCERMEKLWFNNLIGVRQIIIPKEYKSPEKLRRERENELPPSSVTRDFYADSYQVKETSSSHQKNDLETEYKVDIRFRKKQETNIPEEVADVRCYGFTKNGEVPDDKMSAISLACMETIYPISFILPFQGKIAGIFEFEKLKNRYAQKRPELEDFFTGDIYQLYLDKFGAYLDRQDFIVKQFSSSLLYQLLFPKMEWFHKTRSWTESFYLIQNSFPLKCTMTAGYDHEDTETVETLLKGTIEDAFSLQEILLGISFDEKSDVLADGEMEFRYITDKNTKKMLKAEASVTFKNDDELYSKKTIKLTKDEKISEQK